MQLESMAQQKHRQLNEKYLKRREQMPTTQMVDKLSEAEIDSLTAIKERQVMVCSSERYDDGCT